MGNSKSVFWSTKTVSVICAKFQVILWEFANFQKFRQKKKVVKCYNHRSTLGIPPQCIITCSNFVLSTTGSDSVMCSKFQINLMQYGDFQNEQRYQRDSPWKLYIEVKSWTVCKTTKMYPGQFKVAFFINKDCFGHLCKVSSDFARICKLSEIEEEKRKW